uniref:Uncharacterized protein n=1 Tax=Anguilla anguilla TaxID=7936 RepID=A0A0E9V369_ANGAN
MTHSITLTKEMTK